MTLTALRVLRTFQAAGRPLYGAEVMGATGLSSGTVYPLLHRLEGLGLVACTWETADPRRLGRPRRGRYVLQPAGQAEVQDTLGRLAWHDAGMHAHTSLVKACLGYLGARGAWAVVLQTGVFALASGRWAHAGRKGAPDILCILPGGGGRLVAIECKTGRGRLRPGQADTHRQLEALGARVLVVRSVTDLEQLFDTS